MKLVNDIGWQCIFSAFKDAARYFLLPPLVFPKLQAWAFTCAEEHTLRRVTLYL